MSWDERAVVEWVERVDIRDLRLWVRQGWVRPAQGEAGPVFDEVDVARIRLLCDLKDDMALPTDAFEVVLDLIDRLHQTRRELRAMAEVLAEQPEEVRHRVVARVQTLHGAGHDGDADAPTRGGP